ncbi:MAG: PilZ domain-containing protein [Vicinamibacterales bacterium]
MSAVRHTSKRRTPRLDPMSQLTATHSTGQPVVTLVDISLEGFAVHSLVAFEGGSRHQFSFTTAHGHTLQLVAVLVSSHRLESSHGMLHVSGFRFDVTGPAMRQDIGMLIDAVTSPLTFL